MTSCAPFSNTATRTRSGGKPRSPSTTTTAGSARFRLDTVGLWRYTIEAWTDHFESWRDEVEKKRDAGQNIELELVEGAGDRRSGAARSPMPVMPRRIRERCCGISPRGDTAARTELLLSPAARELMAPLPGAQRRRTLLPRSSRSSSTARRRGFAAWYEMFPRSQGPNPARARASTIASRACPRSRGSASMSSTSCRSIRSAASTARARTTPPLPSPATRAAPMRSARPRAGTARSTPSSARSPISAALSPPPRRWGWRSRSISRSKRRPTILGCASIRNGFGSAPTGRSNTPRTRRRNTRTSSMSISTTRTARGCGPNCATRSCSGSTRACAPSGSTTRTPSRCRSGNG